MGDVVVREDVPRAALIGAAVAIAERLDGLLAGARFLEDEHHQYAGRLCLTIAEAFSAVVAVIRSPVQTHAPTLVRTMLETLVDLQNLIADPAYLDQMRFDNADQALKIFAGFRDDPDAGIREEERRGLDRWIALEQRIYEQTRTPARENFSIYRKFERAGMLDMYRGAYRFLCSVAHNDLNTLRARHGRGPQLRFKHPLRSETLGSIIGLAARLYAMAIRTTPRYSSISERDANGAADWANDLIEQRQNV